MKTDYTRDELLEALLNGENVFGLTWVRSLPEGTMFFAPEDRDKYGDRYSQDNKDKYDDRWIVELKTESGWRVIRMEFYFATIDRDGFCCDTVIIEHQQLNFHSPKGDFFIKPIPVILWDFVSVHRDTVNNTLSIKGFTTCVEYNELPRERETTVALSLRADGTTTGEMTFPLSDWYQGN